MVTTSHSVTVDLPKAEVFAFLSDPQKYLLWQSDVVKIEATKGMQEGSVITFTSVGLGRTFELEAKITENNGTDHIEAVSTRGPLTFISKYDLIATDGGTQVHLFNDIRTHGIFNLAAGVLQSIGETKYQADLQRLKIVLENKVQLSA